MRNPYLKVCLVTATLFGSVSTGFALPDCLGDDSVRWDLCIGMRTYSNGNKYLGEWKDGKANGKGTHSLADGSKYVGEYKNGKPYGQSTKVWSNGTTNDGTWIEGLFVFE